jgi:hypothetical protein
VMRAGAARRAHRGGGGDCHRANAQIAHYRSPSSLSGLID